MRLGFNNTVRYINIYKELLQKAKKSLEQMGPLEELEASVPRWDRSCTSFLLKIIFTHILNS